MKNSGEQENYTVTYHPKNPSDTFAGKQIIPIRPQKQSSHHLQKKNAMTGWSGDLHFGRLTTENERLKALVEDLVADKQAQARKITELNDANSRLKKALAEALLPDA